MIWHVKTILKSKAEIRKLRPIGRIHGFCYELRMRFTFLNDWGVGEEYFAARGNYMKLQCQFYWNTDPPAYCTSLLFMAVFCTTTAELNSCNRDNPSKSKAFTG